LSTARLSQLLEHHPYLSKLAAADLPSLDNILSINTIDLETQDHILNYQLPVAVSRHNVGLVIIDSIAANYRAEYAADNMESISMRSGELTRLGELLRNLAAKEDIAIVVANQVSDRFSSLDEQPHLLTGQVHRESPAVSSLPISRAEGGTMEPIPSSPAILSSPHMEDEFSDGSYLMSHPVRNETLSLSHQQRFFTGWGDSPEHDILSPPKNPALGLVWSTQIACRIALKKEDKHVSSDIIPFSTVGNHEAPQREHGKVHPTPAECSRADVPQKTDENRPTDIAEFPTSIDLPQTRKRIMKLVFAPWAAGTAATAENLSSDEVEFEIWKGGIRSLPIGEE
jgi:DNA repair protein RAD57